MCSSKAYVDDIIQISTLKRHKAINKTETSMIFLKNPINCMCYEQRQPNYITYWLNYH